MSCWRNDGTCKENFPFHLMNKVNKLISFFALQYFLKEIENMFYLFLMSYWNTSESLGELEKAVETLACSLCSHSISHSPKLSLDCVSITPYKHGTFFLFLEYSLLTKHLFIYLSTLMPSSDNHEDNDESSRNPLRVLLSFSLATLFS